MGTVRVQRMFERLTASNSTSNSSTVPPSTSASSLSDYQTPSDQYFNSIDHRTSSSCTSSSTASTCSVTASVFSTASSSSVSASSSIASTRSENQPQNEVVNFVEDQTTRATEHRYSSVESENRTPHRSVSTHELDRETLGKYRTPLSPDSSKGRSLTVASLETMERAAEQLRSASSLGITSPTSSTSSNRDEREALSDVRANVVSFRGASMMAARADHVHAVLIDAPVPLSTESSAGTSGALCRADHVHAHGDLPGGDLHDAATSARAGFMSSVDKLRLDSLTVQMEEMKDRLLQLQRDREVERRCSQRSIDALSTELEGLRALFSEHLRVCDVRLSAINTPVSTV